VSNASTILVAGIGNIFHGDDAFGSEVARQLLRRKLPESVKVVDFGIRAMDLTYALLDGHASAILIDITPRGGEPGKLYVIEPQLPERAPDSSIEGHGLNPVSVLALAKSMGELPRTLRLVGCEPSAVDLEEMEMGLSAPVQAALEPAVSLVCEVIDELRGGLHA